MANINIREALKDIDRRTNCQYDLYALYEACNLSEEDKIDLVKLINSDEDAEVIADKLKEKCNEKDKQVWMTKNYSVDDFNDAMDFNGGMQTMAEDYVDDDVTDLLKMYDIDSTTLKETSSGFLPGMGYCPACGGTRFNTNRGFCLDCGYNEGDWGYTNTDDYDDLDESYIPLDKVSKEIEQYLNYHLGGNEDYVKVTNIRNISKDTVSVEYEVHLSIPIGNDEYESDTEYRSLLFRYKDGKWQPVVTESKSNMKTKTTARKLVDKTKADGKKLSMKDAEEIDESYEDGWAEEDINLHKSIDWKSRNYMDFPVTTDSFVGEAILYGEGKDKLKNVKMIKYLVANPVYPPYYAPEENPFKEYSNVVGPMYDGRKHGSYQIHNRYETQELYDTLFESAVNNDKSFNSNNVFEIGDMFEFTGLYGGSYDCKIVGRNKDIVTVNQTWISEDTGKEISKTTKYDVHTDDEGEYIVIWQYRNEEGKVYAHSTVSLTDSFYIESKLVSDDCKLVEALAPYKKEEFKKQLQDELYDKMIKLFYTPEWGYENIKEIDDFINPIIKVEDYKGEYDNDIEVEFRAEFNYRELEDVCNTLDKVVEKYDKNAYFEPVQPGIAVAYLKFPKKLKEDFEDDEIVTGEQEFDSAATSINSNKLPAVYSMVDFTPGQVVIDFGGGKFDNAVNYLKDKDVTLLVYDPYNRSSEHNKEVLRLIRENGGADAAINSNVLNVIKEPEARQQVLKNIKKLVKPGAPIYITVYEGTGKGNEGPTKSGYQLNRKTSDYMDEISKVFSNVNRRGKLITAINESFSSSALRQANIDAIDYFMEFEDIYTFPKGEFLATDWKDLRDGIVMGMDSDFEIAEGIMEYLQKEIDFNNKHKEIYEDDPQAELTLEIYNRVKKEYEKEISKYESVSSEAVNEDSYGGAFDIEDDQYFTKEDIMDLADEVCERLYKEVRETFDIYDLYMRDNVLHIELESDSYFVQADVEIDMRKIRKPMDIMKYALPITKKLLSQVKDSYQENLDEAKTDWKDETSTETVYIYLDDVIVTVDENTWDYATTDWARIDGEDEWYSSDGVLVVDSDDVIDDFSFLIEDYLPKTPGKYKLSCDAELKYNISNIYARYDAFPEYDGNGDYTMEYDKEVISDDAEVEFDKKNSKVEDVVFSPVE